MFDHEIRDIAERVLTSCRKRRLKVVTAESCTGGLVSSDVVDRGFITYSNEAKHEMLGVALDTLEKHGAVSEPVARAMARGALTHSLSDISVSVTGVAGPAGGSVDKPVGLVHFAAARSGFELIAERHVFPGDRDGIRRLATITALGLLAALAER
jgi:nicotinamide-nucleotide amidase